MTRRGSIIVRGALGLLVTFVPHIQAQDSCAGKSSTACSARRDSALGEGTPDTSLYAPAVQALLTLNSHAKYPKRTILNLSHEQRDTLWLNYLQTTGLLSGTCNNNDASHCQVRDAAVLTVGVPRRLDAHTALVTYDVVWRCTEGRRASIVLIQRDSTWVATNEVGIISMSALECTAP